MRSTSSMTLDRLSGSCSPSSTASISPCITVSGVRSSDLDRGSRLSLVPCSRRAAIRMNEPLTAARGPGSVIGMRTRLHRRRVAGGLDQSTDRGPGPTQTVAGERNQTDQAQDVEAAEHEAPWTPEDAEEIGKDQTHKGPTMIRKRGNPMKVGASGRAGLLGPGRPLPSRAGSLNL